MQILEFTHLCAGKWFSQRTVHTLPPQSTQSGRSDLWIEILEADHAAVVQLCEAGQQPRDRILTAMQTRWEATLAASPEKQTGSALLVLFKTDAATGDFIQQCDRPSAVFTTGHYEMEGDRALILTTTSDSFHALERLWFASENLRLRTSIVKYPDSTQVFSFCSEIRMGVAPPKA